MKASSIKQDAIDFLNIIIEGLQNLTDPDVEGKICSSFVKRGSIVYEITFMAKIDQGGMYWDFMGIALFHKQSAENI